jgi:hypothetical protein
MRERQDFQAEFAEAGQFMNGFHPGRCPATREAAQPRPSPLPSSPAMWRQLRLFRCLGSRLPGPGSTGPSSHAEPYHSKKASAAGQED